MARELRWIPAGGGPHIVLNDRGAGYKVTKGLEGLGVPPVEHVTDTTPLLGGEQILETYETGRTIMLPMLITAPTNILLRTRIRALVAAMDPYTGGWLEVAQADGQRRRVAARYSAGLEGAEDAASGGDHTWWRLVLRLYAPDPAWVDPVPVVIPFTYPAPTSFFPLLPLTVSADSVLGAATITNPGDLPAWPVWTATAPGTGVTLDNTSTGEQLHLSGALTDTLTIITQPGRQAITMGTADWWDHLVDNPVFWQIPRGVTAVSLSLTGAGPGSSVALSFNPRYRAAW